MTEEQKLENAHCLLRKDLLERTSKAFWTSQQAPLFPHCPREMIGDRWKSLSEEEKDKVREPMAAVLYYLPALL